MSSWIITYIISSIIQGVILWLAIRIIDVNNLRNNFWMAIVICLLMNLPLVNLYGLILLGILLYYHYDLDIVQIIAVIVVMYLIGFGLGWIFKEIGSFIFA